MTHSKRGFVLYFDNIEMINALAPDQRGLLLSALFDYAARVWRDTTVCAEEILVLYPQMEPPAQMAMRYLASGILRDTNRWLSRREARAQRKQEQSAAASAGSGVSTSAPAAQPARTAPAQPARSSPAAARPSRRDQWFPGATSEADSLRRSREYQESLRRAVEACREG